MNDKNNKKTENENQNLEPKGGSLTTGVGAEIIGVLNRLGDIMILSLLFMISCIPVITIGTALASAAYTANKAISSGDGYIFTDKHELVSLYDGSTEYIMSAKPKLTTASEYGLITHSGSSVKCGSREVLRCSSPAYILSCKNLCAAVYSDFSYDITKLNTENDNAKPDKSPAESNRSLRNNSVVLRPVSNADGAHGPLAALALEAQISRR